MSAGTNSVSKLDYIDAVRGWAILLVIMSHVWPAFPNLHWAVRKLMESGAFGVHLFFLASAVTLMRSWQHRKAPLGDKAKDFLIRRFLRIAPLYYAGAVFYLVAMPPAEFNFVHFVRTLTFTNVWMPEWVSTEPKGWQVVPGGWSIGVEFTFYLLFPLVAATVTNIRQALLLFAATLLLSAVSGPLGDLWFADYPLYTHRRAFLYFWFPNQAFIFAAGVVLYFLLDSPIAQIRSARSTYLLAGAIGVFWVFLSRNSPTMGHFTAPLWPSSVFYALFPLAAFVLVLARSPESLLTHRWLRSLGTISFSAYVTHFFFIEYLQRLDLFDTSSTDLRGLAMAAMFSAATLAGTVLVSLVTYRWIEQPGIELARRLTGSRLVTPQGDRIPHVA